MYILTTTEQLSFVLRTFGNEFSGAVFVYGVDRVTNMSVFGACYRDLLSLVLRLRMDDVDRWVRVSSEVSAFGALFNPAVHIGLSIRVHSCSYIVV